MVLANSLRKVTAEMVEVANTNTLRRPLLLPEKIRRRRVAVLKLPRLANGISHLGGKEREDKDV